MQRERFLEPFFQTPRGGGIKRLQFGDEAVQGTLRIIVCPVRTRGLEFSPPLPVLRLWQIAEDVFAFVPLTALYRDVVAKHVAYGGAQSLRAIQHDGYPFGAANRRAISSRTKAAHVRLFSVAVCTSPKTRFSPSVVTPKAMTT